MLFERRVSTLTDNSWKSIRAEADRSERTFEALLLNTGLAATLREAIHKGGKLLK